MAQAVKKQRDPRLDFFRGVAMLIIFIAHVPGNHWNNFIPASFGYSDAAEMFVFCSGFAAAIAFGGTFRKAGFLYGTTRILYRVWQLYSSHVLIFFLIAGLMVARTAVLSGKEYINSLNLGYFFDDTAEALLGLLTLTYVPNYFDILPMYMVALLFVPLFMLLGGVHPLLAVGASVALYLANWIVDLGLPAHPGHAEIEWYFNPFGWQLVFFTGFAISLRWLPVPGPSRALTFVAITIVVTAIPVSHWWFFSEFGIEYPFHANLYPIFQGWRETLAPWWDKTDYGILRYVHFLALAYLAIQIVRGREHLMLSPYARPILVIGQQALPVFLLNLFIARLAGMVLDEIGRDQLTWALVNIAGLMMIVGFAYTVSWIKSAPWKAAAERRAAREREAASRRHAGDEEYRGASLYPAE